MKKLFGFDYNQIDDFGKPALDIFNTYKSSQGTYSYSVQTNQNNTPPHADNSLKIALISVAAITIVGSIAILATTKT
jgi:hypothetical protein